MLSGLLFKPLAFLSEKKGKDRSFLLNMIQKGSVCAEVGVWKAGFSAEILEKVKPRELHLIDPWEYMPSYPHRLYGGASAKNQTDMDEIYKDVKNKFKKVRSVVIHRDFSHDAASKFKKNYFDFVYIDGDHSYEYVKKDLEDFFPKVKKGGIIAGDDYRSLWGVMSGFGVKKAVDEFIKKRRLETLYLGEQFVLRK